MTPVPSTPRALAAGAGALLAALAACRSPEAHFAEADRQSYAILEERRAALGLDLGPIHLEPAVDRMRERLLEQEPEAEPVTIGLVEALSVAAENSREYQRRKELLYLAALDLTLARFRFQVQTNGSLGAFLTGNGEEVTSRSLEGGFGFTRLLGTGARIVGDIGFGLFRDLTTGDSFDPISTFSLSVTQPLLRGSGQRIVMEPLTQAERDVVYQVREFERFRRTFAVNVYSRYLRIVQQVDRVSNQRKNFKNLNLLAERNTALAEAGRMSDIQMDQARQEEVTSISRLIQEEQQLQNLLDDFKFFLGLPPQARIQVVPDSLEKLSEAEPEPLGFEDPDWLSEYALQWRLDHQTSLDAVDDAERRSYVARDALRSAMDVAGGVRGVTSGDGNALEFGKDDLVWDLGVNLDFALTRLPERNVYRESLINLAFARRNAQESEDSIRVQVRDRLRQAQRTLETWRLQGGAVELAERRVESTSLSLEAGRAATRDILEAQEALLAAQNNKTNALIDQRLAVLNLWLDLGLLRLDEAGLTPQPELLDLLETHTP